MKELFGVPKLKKDGTPGNVKVVRTRWDAGTGDRGQGASRCG